MDNRNLPVRNSINFGSVALAAMTFMYFFHYLTARCLAASLSTNCLTYYPRNKGAGNRTARWQTEFDMLLAIISWIDVHEDIMYIGERR